MFAAVCTRHLEEAEEGKRRLGRCPARPNPDWLSRVPRVRFKMSSDVGGSIPTPHKLRALTQRTVSNHGAQQNEGFASVIHLQENPISPVNGQRACAGIDFRLVWCRFIFDYDQN
ncbi:TetR family transcriptional regulator [Anopheles sinensis]|uniref:TetR family transcriptional regulator n=1 Tax=Anopheles sinensis TaxID=74873 RepID=A0A084VHF4_ANOSI|nr:TetR family transcriptional regulator [Anopheles sinensis]